MNLETIETALSKAKRIEFFCSEGPNEPSVMGLVFDYELIFDALEAYKYLQSKFKHKDITLSIRKRPPGIAVSIISNSTAEVFNLATIKETGMNEFMTQLPSNTPFVLVIFQEAERGLTIIQTNATFSPIVIRGYSVE